MGLIIAMLYLRFTPSLESSRMLDELQRARETLDQYRDVPDAYAGELRRHAIALSVHYSTRIEGNTLTLEQVESLLRGRQIAAPVSQQQEALNYREAMQYAQVVANAASPRITEETVKTIHFLVTKSLPGGYNPGQYRFVQNFVINSATQRPLFRPPPPDRVQPLMEEYLQWLNTPREGLPPYYRAALAHLNFVAIHPFDDGNGRTARILEALVLYLAGYRSQELVSLEAYFGRDTQGYYRAIADSLGPAYDPQDRDVTPWTDYYLRAHAAQAAAAAAETRLHRAQIDRLAEAFAAQLRGNLDRLIALWVACTGGTITNSDYRDFTGVGNQTAARHLREMAAAGLLIRRGTGRGIHYVPTEAVLRVYQEVGEEIE